jgi:translocation and assembly module TamB
MIGVPARLSATANLVVTGLHSDIKGNVNIRRIDGNEGTLAATFNYNAATGAIAAEVAAAEPAGGLIATLLESPGLPPLRGTLVGRGKVSDMQVGLTFESAGKVFTIGKGRTWLENATQRFSVTLDGYLTTILPKRLRDILAGRTKAKLVGSYLENGSVQFDTASLQSEMLDIKAHGLFNPARSFAHGEAVLALKSNDGSAVRLPLLGASVLSVVEADAKLVLSHTETDRPLSLTATLRGLESSAHGRVHRIQLMASALQPRATGQNWRALKSVVIDVSATGIAATDKRVQDIAAPDLSIKLRGRADQSSFVVDQLAGSTRSVKLTGSGIVKGDRFDGRLEATIPKLAVFSAIASRQLGGSATLSGQGYWAFSDGSANVAIELDLTDPRAGIRQLDALLSGSNKISGTLRKDRHSGLKLTNLTLDGAGLEGKADLQLTGRQPSGQMQLTVRDLQRLDPTLRGSLAANGKLGGKPGALRASLDLTGDSIRLHGKPVEQFTFEMQASGSIDNLSGDAKLQSRIDGIATMGKMRLSRDPQSGVKLQDVALNYGPNELRGWLQFGGQKGVDGDLALDAPALKTLSALVGKSISGEVTARLTQTGKVTARGLKLAARANNVVVGSISITRATASAEISDAFSNARGFGRVHLSGGSIYGRAVSELTIALDAKDGATTAFGLDGRSGTETLSAGGTFELGGKGTTVTLQRGQLIASSVVAKLAEPAKIQFTDGKLSLSRLRLGVGSGHVTVTANSGKTLQIAAELSKLPMSLFDMAAPDIGAGGELSGRIDVTGTPSKPIANYKLDLAGGNIAALQRAGIAPISVSSNGNFKNNVLSLQAKASGADGLIATANGTVSLKPAPVLNVQTNGQFPLTLLNALLAERGTRGAGFLRGNVAITGATSDPQFSGTASIASGAIHDPGSGLQLTNLQMSARISKSQFTVDRLDASALPGGRLTATGRVLFDRQAGFPVTAQLQADGLQVRDRKTLDGKLNGRLSVNGALNRGLLVGGNIFLQRFDIQIPERLPRTVRELDVTHVNISKESRARLGIKEQTTRQSATTPIRLNLDIKSDGRIFVRGRGLDAQLGGDLRLLGTSKQPVAEGEFRMIRGRLAIIGRRLIFNRGRIGFTGSLDPALDFEANTDADGTIITTTVSGRASDPKVAFTSSPQLPEDELLARLLFNKSLSKLSPLQIAQLASEVDKIGGLSSGPGIMDQLRKSVGVDVLDVTTDTKGNAAVTAGKYVNSKAYIGVQQNTGTNTSRVIVDLDITKNIKARGETGSDGNSKLGVGIEWNY